MTTRRPHGPRAACAAMALAMLAACGGSDPYPAETAAEDVSETVARHQGPLGGPGPGVLPGGTDTHQARVAHVHSALLGAVGSGVRTLHAGSEQLGDYGRLLHADGWQLSVQVPGAAAPSGPVPVWYLNADVDADDGDSLLAQLRGYEGVVVVDSAAGRRAPGAASAAGELLLRAGAGLDPSHRAASAFMWLPRRELLVPIFVAADGSVNGVAATQRKLRLMGPDLLAAHAADGTAGSADDPDARVALAALVDLAAAATAWTPAPGAAGLLEPLRPPPAGVTYFRDPSQTAGVTHHATWMQARIGPPKALAASQLTKVRALLVKFRALTSMQRNEVVKAYLRSELLSGSGGVTMVGKPAEVLLALRDSGYQRADGVGRLIEYSRLNNYTNPEVAELRSAFSGIELSYYNWARGEMLRLDPLVDLWYRTYERTRSAEDRDEWERYRTQFRNVQAPLQRTQFRFAYIQSNCSRRLNAEVHALSQSLNQN